MGTPNRYIVVLGGAVMASAWSLHSANEKLTAAVLIRASERGLFPVEGQIFNATGQVIKTRFFPTFFHSDDLEAL